MTNYIIKDFIVTSNIRDINISFADIPQSGGLRKIFITGDIGAKFYLEIKNEDSNYYNFYTNTFSSSYARLEDEITRSDGYSKNIKFPEVSDDDQYDFFLYAKPGTKHDNLRTVKDAVGNIDINLTRGSSSVLLQKVVYQILDVSAILGATINSTNAVTINSGTTETITFNRNSSNETTNSFSITGTISTSGALTVDRQPLISDLFAYKEITLGANPVDIEGENIYPSISDTDTVDGGVLSGIKVVMDNNVADKMKVGDRITGNTALDATVVTVAALNPDGDNVKEFSMSEAIAVADGITLSFSNRMNYRWYAPSINNLQSGMTLLYTANATANSTISDYVDKVTINANTENEKDIIKVFKPALDSSDYLPTISQGVVTNPGNIIFNNQQKLLLGGDTIKIAAFGTDKIRQLTGWEIDMENLSLTLGKITTTTTAAVENNTIIPVSSALGITDETTVTVDMPAGSTQLAKYGLTSKTTVLDSVASLRVGQTMRVMSVGTLSGNPTIVSIDETEKSITLSSEQTFADNETLTFDNSTINGIGIDPSVIDPYITNISTLNLTVSAAQTLESGQTFTFPGAGSTFTITGDLIVKRVGSENLLIQLDVDKFLTRHA